MLLGSLVTGPLLDAARRPGPGAAWWLMAGFPAVSAAALALLFRRRRSRPGRTDPAPIGRHPVPTHDRNGST